MKKILVLIPSLLFMIACDKDNPLRDQPKIIQEAFGQKVHLERSFISKESLFIRMKPKGIEDTKFYEGDEVKFTVVADVLSNFKGKVKLSMESLPEGATFDEDTGEFYWLTDRGAVTGYENYSTQYVQVVAYTTEPPAVSVKETIRLHVYRKPSNPEIISVEQIEESDRLENLGEVSPKNIENKVDLEGFFVPQGEKIYLRVIVKDPDSWDAEGIPPRPPELIVKRFAERGVLEERGVFFSPVGQPYQDKNHRDIWHFKLAISWDDFYAQKEVNYMNRDAKPDFYKSEVISFRGRSAFKEISHREKKMTFILTQTPTVPLVSWWDVVVRGTFYLDSNVDGSQRFYFNVHTKNGSGILKYNWGGLCENTDPNETLDPETFNLVNISTVPIQSPTVGAANIASSTPYVVPSGKKEEKKSEETGGGEKKGEEGAEEEKEKIAGFKKEKFPGEVRCVCEPGGVSSSFSSYLDPPEQTLERFLDCYMEFHLDVDKIEDRHVGKPYKVFLNVASRMPILKEGDVPPLNKSLNMITKYQHISKERIFGKSIIIRNEDEEEDPKPEEDSSEKTEEEPKEADSKEVK